MRQLARARRSTETLEVVLLCGPELLRLGVARILTGAGDIAVTAHAEPPPAHARVPVAVVCDRGEADVAKTCRLVRESLADQLVVVLAHPHVDAMLDALGAGASGFVAEQDGERELLGAVRRVARGEYHLSPGLLSLLLDWHRLQRVSRGERSRARERVLLALLAEGRTVEDIANRLDLAPKTVRNVSSGLYRRMGVRSRAEAVRLAEERGLLD
jgi:DNA-binding NarL/FixJ family response regulator